jgi:hypothetical protein
MLDFTSWLLFWLYWNAVSDMKPEPSFSAAPTIRSEWRASTPLWFEFSATR